MLLIIFYKSYLKSRFQANRFLQNYVEQNLWVSNLFHFVRKEIWEGCFQIKNSRIKNNHSKLQFRSYCKWWHSEILRSYTEWKRKLRKPNMLQRSEFQDKRILSIEKSGYWTTFDKDRIIIWKTTIRALVRHLVSGKVKVM